MHLLGRRGFTLVELVVAVLLLGIITTAIYRVLVSNQRIYHAQTQRIDLQQNIRAGATILPAEFRELDAMDGDIKSMSETAISIRAMRQLGVVCDPPVLGGALTGLTMTLRRALFFGMRDFDPARDSVLIYYEGDETTRTDDGWLLGSLTGTASNVECSDDPDLDLDGRRYSVSLALGAGQLNQLGAIPKGAPVRGFEIVTYRAYQGGDGKWYVGLEQPGVAIQPLIGPVTAGGLTLAYFDTVGVATAVPANVAEIEIRLRAQTAQPVRQADGPLATQVDSMVTRVALRNNRRW